MPHSCTILSRCIWVFIHSKSPFNNVLNRGSGRQECVREVFHGRLTGDFGNLASYRISTSDLPTIRERLLITSFLFYWFRGEQFSRRYMTSSA